MLGGVLLLTLAAANRRNHAESAIQHLASYDGLNFRTITKATHLWPLTVIGVEDYASAAKYYRQSWTLFFIAGFISLLAALNAAVGQWRYILATVPIVLMVGSLIGVVVNLRRKMLLENSGRLDANGHIRPPITPTE